MLLSAEHFSTLTFWLFLPLSLIITYIDFLCCERIYNFAKGVSSMISTFISPLFECVALVSGGEISGGVDNVFFPHHLVTLRKLTE